MFYHYVTPIIHPCLENVTQFSNIFSDGANPNQLEKDTVLTLMTNIEVFVFCIFMVGLKDVAEDSAKSFGPLDSNQLGMLICVWGGDDIEITEDAQT